MKVTPISADLLIKIALGAAVLGGMYWIVKRGADGIKGAFASMANLPTKLASDAQAYAREIADAAIVTAKEGGSTWQQGYVPNENYSNEGRFSLPTVQKYSNPLINDQGMDFGNLSG